MALRQRFIVNFRVFSSLMKGYEVSVRFITHYHLQGNPTEKYSRTLKTLLSMDVFDNHRKWHVDLAEVIYARSTSFKESTLNFERVVRFS